MIKTISTPYTRAQKRMKEKEVTATKKYLKKVWGEETPMRKLSYHEIRSLGDKLGINVFGRKNFNYKYSFGQKRLRYYSKNCWKCKRDYNVPGNEKKARPKGPSVCPDCKKN